MCDPISALALAGSAIAAGVSYAGQESTQNAQQKANDDWVAQQKQAAAAANAADTAQRQKATTALQGSEQQLGEQNQQKVQQQAQSTLTNQMLQDSPAAPNANVSLLGGEPADTSVSTDMANRVSAASRDARSRIAALAGMSSYGSGYQGAAGAAQGALADSSQAIGLANNLRQGTTATLGAAQAVQPIHYQQGSDLAGGAAGDLAKIAGSAFGTKMRG